jgi:hypothetical protein
MISAHFLLFFISALLCHTTLASLRPDADQLTGYYLTMSLGGALGGAFNALLAPLIFPLPIEYALILGLVAFVRHYSDPKQSFGLRHLADSLGKGFIPLGIVAGSTILAMQLSDYVPIVILLTLFVLVSMLFLYKNRIGFGIATMIVLACNPGTPWQRVSQFMELKRNFFGVTAVMDNESGQMRYLMHGTTMHGAQALVSPFQLVPMSYYHPQGPAGDTFGFLQIHEGPQRVAALGLGVGSIACYVKAGRSFDFYEINPLVPKIAKNPKYFTFLSDCGSPWSITMGDGRLNIARAKDGTYDMIFLDAFSSDNIPVHLITTEAFQIYRRKLKPHGIIVANISNRYLDLEGVMDAAGKAAGMKVFLKAGGEIHIKDPGLEANPSIYAVFLNDPADTPYFAHAKWGIYDGEPVRAWTYGYSNPFGTIWLPAILKN